MSWYFHVDLDAFYASVEQIDHPVYRGLPVIVGGADSLRGVVSACSYEARAYGVHSAMPIFQARQSCPDGIYLPVRMDRYQQVSRHVMSIIAGYSPTVQQISVDEAFLDMTGMQSLFGEPKEAAAALKEDIHRQTGLRASVGIATNKYIAKMASDRLKPDGLCFVDAGAEYDFISSCELHDMWGFGKKGIQNLKDHHIKTVEQLRAYSQAFLIKTFGQSAGSFYYSAVRGIDPGIFSTHIKSRSISNERTLEENTSDETYLRSLLLSLSHQVMFRMIEQGYRCRTVGIKLKFADLSVISSQMTPEKPIYSAEEVYAYVCSLLEGRWDGERPIRLIGVSLSSLERREEPLQEELFSDSFKRKERLEKTVLKLRSKGNRMIKASDLMYRGKNGSHRKG